MSDLGLRPIVVTVETGTEAWVILLQVVLAVATSLAALTAAVALLNERRSAARMRRRDAVLALDEMLTGVALLGSSKELWRRRAVERTLLERHHVRAIVLLEGDEQVVARWASKRRDEINAVIDTITESNFMARTVGDTRVKAMKMAAEATQELALWLRGERSLNEFASTP